MSDFSHLLNLTHPTTDVSDKYTVITSGVLVEDMKKLGWELTEVKGRKQKNPNKVSKYNRHVMIFNNKNMSIVNEASSSNIEGFPRIIVQNSYDGTSSFIFRVGFYRLVCSNGLVIATKELSNLKLRHIGYTFEDLRTLLHTVLEKLQHSLDEMSRMSEVELSEEQIEEFTVKGIELREHLYGKKEVHRKDQTVSQVSKVRREEDNGNTLWQVFNRVQESLSKGGYEMTSATGRVRTRKPLTSFEKDIELNTKLFELAHSYLS